MKQLDGLLKVARPVVPMLPANFSNRVMAKIEQLDVPIVPFNMPRRYLRWAQLAGSFLLLGLSLVVVNSVIFEIQMNGSVELLFFGTQFFKDVLSYLPFDLIFPALIMSWLSSWLLWKSKTLKRGIAGIIIGSFLTTTFGGAALAATSINGQIQTALITQEQEIPLLSWFYKERARFFVKHPNFRMGRVVRFEKNLVWIVDPHGKTLMIELPAEMNVQERQVISLVGTEADDLFVARAGRHCSPGRVGKYFSHMSSMMRRGNMGSHHRRSH